MKIAPVPLPFNPALLTGWAAGKRTSCFAILI